MKVEQQSIYYEKLSIEKKIEHNKLKRTSRHQRVTVLISLFILIIFSIANMVSTTFYNSVTLGKNIILSFGTPSKHIFWIIVGVITLFAVSKIPYNFYQKKKVRGILFFGSVFVLVGILIGAKFTPEFVPEINGSIGWIRIKGLTIQPSEIFKVSYVITLAHFLELSYKRKQNTKGIIGNIFPIVAVFFILVFRQGDLGTAIHYILITSFMLLVAPINKRLISGALLSIPIITSFTLYIFYMEKIIGGGYRLRRIMSYVEILLKGKERDAGIGYQVIQSLIAMGNGGITGRGYGNGVQKYNYLPEIHTDFISSSLAEEWGIMMMIMILLIFLLVLRISINTAIITKHYFAKFLVVGLASLIFTQMLMNLYVATGLMPVTGIPLPLFSYGGSSTLTIFISIGIILNVNKRMIKDKYS